MIEFDLRASEAGTVDQSSVRQLFYRGDGHQEDRQWHLQLRQKLWGTNVRAIEVRGRIKLMKINAQ